MLFQIKGFYNEFEGSTGSVAVHGERIMRPVIWEASFLCGGNGRGQRRVDFGYLRWSSKLWCWLSNMSGCASSFSLEGWAVASVGGGRARPMSFGAFALMS